MRIGLQACLENRQSNKKAVEALMEELYMAG